MPLKSIKTRSIILNTFKDVIHRNKIQMIVKGLLGL